MIAIARALMAAPKMLMLDEPSLGLAPMLVKEIFDNIQTDQRETAPPFWWWSKTPKRLGRLQLRLYHGVGQNRAGRPIESLQDNPDVKEFYMGVTQGGGRKSFKEVKSYKRRKRWM